MMAIAVMRRGQIRLPTHALVEGKGRHGASRHVPLRVPQRAVGWVFQTSGLLPLLTAAENVALALRIQGRPVGGCAAPALEALEAVGLEERAQHRAFELSGGEQQRVAIARALVKQPRLLLADEPTGQLDTETAHEVVELIRAAAGRGTTVVMATHDASLAAVADRVVTIEDGRLAEKPASHG